MWGIATRHELVGVACGAAGQCPAVGLITNCWPQMRSRWRSALRNVLVTCPRSWQLRSVGHAGARLNNLEPDLDLDVATLREVAVAPAGDRSRFLACTTRSSCDLARGMLNCHRRDTGMFECFLLLGNVGATWAPLIAIPAVITAGTASMWLILSGIKGIITRGPPPRRGVARAWNPDRIVNWIDKRPNCGTPGNSEGTWRDPELIRGTEVTVDVILLEPASPDEWRPCGFEGRVIISGSSSRPRLLWRRAGEVCRPACANQRHGHRGPSPSREI